MSQPESGEEHPVQKTDGTGDFNFVDELVEEGDYWLTLTDAARITRRQEVTIRRWVATGVLPVRRQRMGLNKRTRHVRASDLGKLTPIVDPAAMISGQAAQVDLLSIPAQQAQIQATYHEVMHQLNHLAQTLNTFEQQQSERQHQDQETLVALRHELMGYVQHLQHEQERGMATLTEALQQQRERSQSQLQQIASTWEYELAQRQAAETGLAEMIQGVKAIISGVQTAVQHVEQDQQAHLVQTTHQQQVFEQGLRERQHDHEQIAMRMVQLEDVQRHLEHQQQEADLCAQNVLKQQIRWQRQQRHFVLAQRGQRRWHR